MEKKTTWKRLTAAALAILIFATDQSVLYATEMINEPEVNDFGEEQDLPDLSDLEENPEGEQKTDEQTADEQKTEDPNQTPEEQQSLDNPENVQEDDENGADTVEEQPEEIEKEPEQGIEGTSEEQQELRVEDSWFPQYIANSYEEDEFLFDQPLIGQTDEDESYEYEKSYGNQLAGTLAGELYEKLEICWENIGEGVEAEPILLGNVKTSGRELEGEEYEPFSAAYKKAAQNAFDAFLFDKADANLLDKDKSELLVTFFGVEQEDGTCLWSIEAKWNLVLEDDAKIESSDGNNSEESEETLYETIKKIYTFLTTEWEQAEDPDAETYARMLKRYCEQKEVECVLITGIVDNDITVWNAVRMEDENWYAIDISRNIFLAGLGESEPEEEAGGFELDHQIYGDFSNSHNGMFLYPELNVSDYVSEALTEKENPALDPATPPVENTTTPEPTAPSVSTPEESKPTEEETQTTQKDTTEIPIETEAKTEIATNEDEIVSLQMEGTYGMYDAVGEAGATPVIEEKALTQVTISSIKAQTYTGRAITPKVIIKDINTKKTLKLNKQYTVSYENNINAGTAVVVVRGIDGSGYDGVARAEFTILPCNVAKKVNCKVIGKGFSFTGQPITPEVSLTYNKMGLVLGTDYQISYINNTAKGNAQIQLTGIGNYTGTKILKFKIAAKKIKETSVVLSSYDDVYAGDGSLPTVTVTYNGMVCQQGVDYTVKYPKKLKIGKNPITITGKGSYTGSIKVNYIVTKASLNDAEVYFPYAWQFTNKNIKVLPTSVSIDGVNLQAKKDYTIKYQASNGKKTSSVKNSGTYQIILTGKGNYQGTLVFDFCITEDQNMLNQNYNSAESTIKKPDPVPEEPEVPDTSPADKVTVEKDRYWGYYEGYKITSKKGIQGVSEYTEDTQAQHILLNVDLADLISITERAGYIPYTYKGKTYYFSDLIALKQTVYYLHGWGSSAENPYGNHMRNVTFVLLMSWRDDLSYLIHPSARKKGAAPYYALNMQEGNARDTFEALFRYMGEELGEYKTRVSNWTLGNEVNSCKDWNYSGNMSLNDCVANYAQAFQSLYRGVKRAATSSRVFISLDHCWTASVAGHSGKAFLDQFASYMNQTAPDVQWNVNFHPYSQPLNRTSFWGDNSNTTNSLGTKYISMKNIQVLTDYLGTLEAKYGKANNSIRVIIGELGYTATQGNASSEAEQAAALGYGYYIAMFNTRIDSYIIRAYLDAPEETASGLYLGLRNKTHVKKESYDVFKYLDTNQSLNYMNNYLSQIGLASWESAIPGFHANALPAVDF